MQNTLRFALSLFLVACKVEAHQVVEGPPSAAAAGDAPASSAHSSAPDVASAPSAAPSAPPVPPVVRPTPTYAAGPTSAALCEDFLRKARRRDAKLPTVGDFGGGGFPVLTFDSACFPTPRGAWALEVGDVRPTTVVRDGKSVTEQLAGSYHPVHLAAPGKRSDGPGVSFVVSEWNSFMLDQDLFDYDGDGEPELLLHTQTTEHTAAGTSAEAVFTASGGAVRRYGPAAPFAATMSKDVDADGRPDLLFTGEEPFRIDGLSDTPHTSMLPELLFAAHSLPDGTFSSRDAAAVAYVRGQCPTAPTIIVSKDGAVDELGSLKNVHCARLWGAPTTDIDAQLTRDCGPRTGRRATNACANFDVMTTWARFDPPLSLGGGGREPRDGGP